MSEEETILPARPLKAEELARAEAYSRQSELATEQDTKINAALSAGEYYVQAQDYLGAQNVIQGINPLQLNQVQSDRFGIVQAYVNYAQGDPIRALAILQAIWERPGPLDSSGATKIE